MQAKKKPMTKAQFEKTATDKKALAKPGKGRK